MRGGRRPFGLLGCVLLSAGMARAAEVEARGPSECPDSAELGFRVERSLGTSLAQAPMMRFVVAMERSAGGYAARLTATGEGDAPSKERDLAGADCEELADALVVAMTLALGDADATEVPPPGARAESPASDGPSSRGLAATAAAAVVEEDAKARPDGDGADAGDAGVRPALSVAALVDVGSLPAPGFGAAVGGELRWRRLQLRALGTLLLEQHAELGAPAPAPGADLRLFAGSLHGCTSPVQAGAFALPVCLGFELGWLTGVGTGVAAPRSGSAPWAAPRLDAGGRWCARSSPVCLGLTLTAATPITRSRFELTNIGTVYRPAPVTGRLSFGVDVGFD